MAFGVSMLSIVWLGLNFLQNNSTIHVILPIMLLDLSNVVLNCSCAYVPARIGCCFYIYYFLPEPTV